MQSEYSKCVFFFISLKQAAEVGLKMWKSFESQEPHTNGRACSYYRGKAMCALGEGLAPIKDFPPRTSKDQQREGGWRRRKVKLGMLALPQRHFLYIFFA